VAENGSKKTYMIQDATYYKLRDALRDIMDDIPGDTLTPIGLVLVNVHNKSEITLLLGPGMYAHDEVAEMLKGMKSPQIAYIDLPQKHLYEANLRGEGSSSADDLPSAN
jgi:hypothetical protein